MVRCSCLPQAKHAKYAVLVPHFRKAERVKRFARAQHMCNAKQKCNFHVAQCDSTSQQAAMPTRGHSGVLLVGTSCTGTRTSGHVVKLTITVSSNTRASLQHTRSLLARARAAQLRAASSRQHPPERDATIKCFVTVTITTSTFQHRLLWLSRQTWKGQLEHVPEEKLKVAKKCALARTFIIAGKLGLQLCCSVK
jgi:hypothetical protein